MKKATIKVGDVFTTNDVYDVVVIKYIDTRNITIKFKDEHGYEMKVLACNLRKGNIKNPYHRTVYGVGYLGVGEFSPQINGKQSYVYKIWNAMIQRCYDEKAQIARPTYKNCIVSDDWHNFQNFAEWYTSQKKCDKGYHLDKDILNGGNRVYSAETCVLAPLEINSLLCGTLSSNNEYPVGVSFSKVKNKFIATLKINAHSKQIGAFDSVIEASQAYQEAKKEYIKQKALEWKDRIDDKLFNALMAKVA